MAGRARRSVEVRREQILSTTVELLDRLGLAATRVADVAKALEVSPALVFYHFGTKDDLVAEAFAHAVERDLHRLEKAAAGDDPVERLRRVLRLYGPTGRATGWRIWIDAWAVALRDPHIRKLLKRLDHRWQDILRGVVDDGVAAKVFTCPDPAGTVARLSALVDGLSVAAVVHRSVTREQLRSWVAGQLAVELGVDVETLDGSHLTPASALGSRAG
jgi:AcrR family transcriptional regulator